MNPETVKQKSEAQLRTLGIRVNATLPTIESLDDLSPRSPHVVAERAFVLSYIIGVGYGRPANKILTLIEEAGITEYLSPIERDFLHQSTFSESDISWACWLGEAVQACAWALELVELHPLLRSSDELAAHFLSPGIVPRQRIESATLLPFGQLYAQADLHYRLHWAARQARLNGTAFPQPEICIEMRRRSLDWIIGVPYEWDDIPSDT